jgi:protein-S-isoprenylcysteine O-methyltransferase Ste14
VLTVRGPNIRVPPAIFAAGFLVGLLVEATVTRLPIAAAGTRAVTWTGYALIVVGLLVAWWGIAMFAAARTTIFPFQPANALVQRGPYRFTRNPMYLGMCLGYVGLALLVNAGWPVLMLPVVILAMNRFVIREEEKYLQQRFGDDYAAYRRRVRRWI